jgi:hypothetical protein
VNIGEFFVTLGVDAETLKLKDFVSSIGEIPLKAVAGIAALAGISLALRDVIGDAMDAAVAFGAFEAQTGLSSQELQTWQRVALQANVSAEAVTSSVSALQRQLVDIRMGKGNISPFQILGIDLRQDAFKVIEQLRERVKGMDRGTATSLISQMGLTPDMMQVLTLSDEKFKAFSNTVVGMSPQQIKAFQTLKLELTKLKMELHDLMFRTIGTLLPFLQEFIHRILPALAHFLGNVVAAISSLVGWMFQFKYAVPVAVAAIMTLNAAFAPLTATVTALLLIMEDLYVWSQGGVSVFGKAMEKLTGHKVGPKGLKEDAGIIKGDPGAAGRVTADLLTGFFKYGFNAGKNVGSIEEAAYVSPGEFRERTSKTVTQNNHVTVQVHSTAPAEEVGRHTAKAVKAEISDATIQLGNSEGGGR